MLSARPPAARPTAGGALAASPEVPVSIPLFTSDTFAEGAKAFGWARQPYGLAFGGICCVAAAAPALLVGRRLLPG